ncbi:Succinate--CoA ligase [ADP-forming] subunit beta [Bienertia sinuspersici]
MVGKVVLKFQFKGAFVDVVVNDVDMVNLIDLIIEFWEYADRDKIKTPKYPTFSYVYKMQNVGLESDGDLMKMFGNLPNHDCIYISVGSAANPTKVVQTALQLRASQEKTKSQPHPDVIPCNPHISPLRKSTKPTLQKLTPKRNNYINLPVVIPANPPSPPLRPTESLWENIEVVPIERRCERGRGEGIIGGRGMDYGGGRSDGNVVAEVTAPVRRSSTYFNSPPISPHVVDNSNPDIVELPPLNPTQTQPSSVTSNFEIESSSKTVNNSALLKKRLPRTTAKRLCLFTKVVDMEVTNKNTKKRRRESTVNLSDDFLTEDDIDFGDYNSDEDEAYSPDTTFPEDTDTDESVDDENDSDVDEYIQMVQDYFDPYDEPQWKDYIDAEDEYLDKLYKNDTVWDYCIQNGFSIVVEKANNSKYTVRCSDERCGWRLHGAKLVDRLTWAIKSIKNPEHTCLGLQTRNPMVSAKWACKELLEDIRANNDILGKTLNDLLWKRASGAFSAFTFKKAMVELNKTNPEARIWLVDLGDQERWTKHKFDPSLKCDVNKTNFVESFNATLGIDSLFTDNFGRVRRVTMVRLATRRQACEEWDRAYPSSAGEYEIGDGKSVLPVSLNHHTCRLVYAMHGILLIYYVSMWPDMEWPKIEPPVLKRGVERPCRNRRRGEEEERKGKRSKTVRCTICKEFGHNKLTCKGGPTLKQKKAKKKKKNDDEASTSKAQGQNKASGSVSKTAGK